MSHKKVIKMIYIYIYIYSKYYLKIQVLVRFEEDRDM